MKYQFALYILSIIILASFVSANDSWINWGNYGYENFNDYVLFGSNNPYGNYNFTLKALGLIAEYPPIIADIDNDTKNEMIISNNDLISIVSENFEIESGYSFGEKVCGRMQLVDFDNDEFKDIAVYDSSEQKVKFLEFDGLSVSEIGSINAYDKCDCNIFGEYGADFVVMLKNSSSPSTTMNVTILGFSGFSNITNPFLTGTRLFPAGYTNLTLNMFNPVSVGDIDNDGSHEIMVCGTTGSGGLLSILNEDGTFQAHDKEIITSVVNTLASCNVAWANIGTRTSAKEIITYIIKDYSGTSILTSSTDIKVFDMLGNEKFSSYATGQGFPFVSDMNYDSLNELCFRKQSNLSCYNNYYQSLYNLTLPNYGTSYIALASGEFNGLFTFQEIVLYNGIYTISIPDNNLTLLYPFSGNPSSTFSYPVNYYRKNMAKKDIVVQNNIDTYLYQSEKTNAICGDGICDDTETEALCPEDCFIVHDDTSAAQITKYTINPDPFSVWENGTKVRISVTADTKNNNSVATRVIIYLNETTQWDSNWTDYYFHGTERIFDTYANYTTTGSIYRIYARSAQQPYAIDNQGGSFVVDLLGIDYGEAIYTYTNPLDLGIIDKNKNKASNSIDNGMDAFFGYTGLSRTVLWLVLMVFVALITLIFGYLAHLPSNLIFGTMGGLEVLMFIIGVMMKYIGVGVIITMVILAVLIGAVFVRKHITGA